MAEASAIEASLSKPAAQPVDAAVPAEKPGRYAWFVLLVLCSASVVNAIDRQVLAILTQSVKADLRLTDAQLGFLLGTGFSVFYAVVGIAMGRIADAVPRKKLMASGMVVWSMMTAAGAGANSFGSLGVTRIGVGVGEASANPCAHSLMCDYFPRGARSMALGCYNAGLFVGSAIAMLAGGAILQNWNGVCHLVPGGWACSLTGWRGALLAASLPGLPLALIILSLREPQRPGMEKIALGPLLVREFSACVPPFPIISLYRSGNRGAFVSNLVLLAMIFTTAFGAIALSGDYAQWLAVALGAYTVLTWGQVQKQRDRPFFQLTYGCPTFLMAMIGGALVSAILSGVHAWVATYAMRVLGMSPASAGATLGLVLASMSCVGVIGGGWIADRWLVHDRRAPMWMNALAVALSLPALVVMLRTDSTRVFLMGYAVFTLVASSYPGAIAAMAQDLVLPRMRGSTASAFSLVMVVISASLGPYWIGKVSTVTGSLTWGLLSLQILTPIALGFLIAAGLRLGAETPERRRARAEAAGEPSPNGSSERS
jgi:MFS family permease